MLTGCAGKGGSSSVDGTAPNQTGSASSGKVTITMGMPYSNMILTETINRYNSIQDKYYIQMIDYTEKTGRPTEKAYQDCYREEFNLIKQDIISGRAPDTLAMNCTYMLPYVKTSMFADLYELMDGDTGLDREDILPNVLEGFEYNGKLPVLTTNIYLRTAVAKTKFVGRDAESWTIEKFIETAGKLPEDMQIRDQYELDSIQSIYYYATANLIKECMDFRKYKCDFNEPALTKAMEFALKFPDRDTVKVNFESLSDSDKHLLYSERERNMIDDRALISEIVLTGFGQAEGNDIWMSFGEDDLTFVGYPSKNGNGAVFEDNNFLFGITNNCDSPEAAWEVLSDMIAGEAMQDEMLEHGQGIPVSKAVLDKLYNNKDSSDFRSIYSSFIGSSFDTGKKITQERVNQLYNYIQTVRIDPYRSYELESIINEEADYVMGGERSIESFIEILNDRIGTYFSERE